MVTDHRMILSISKERSTLFDQIRYQGSPESFAWVLPIAGTVDVGLSSNTVFDTLDSLTRTTIQAPPLNCPQQPSNCQAPLYAAGAKNASSGAPDEGVQVLKREVVGPYETVQLQATDPQALHNWLAQNGFVVPDDVKSVIDTYVAEKFNFLALKLIPGKGIQEMRPVRVTTQGAAAVLPLRMVAAGAGPVVGVTLWVLGEGRYEPQNFPSFYIPTEALVWDWTAQKSNYVELRAERAKALGGKGWEMETAPPFSRQSFETIVKSPYNYGPYDGQASLEETYTTQSYPPITDAQGNVIKTAVQLRDEDLGALFAGINPNDTRVTRLRADLSRDALKSDLLMTASSDQSLLPTLRQVTHELNQPLCPVWNGCTQDGTAPRDEAFARSSTGGCRASGETPSSWMAFGVAFVGLAIGDSIRRRRKVRLPGGA